MEKSQELKTINSKVGCFLCKNTSFVLISELDRNDDLLNNFSCKHCGFIMVLPRPNLTTHNDLYSLGGFSTEARGGNKPNIAKIKRSEEIAWLNFKRLQTVLGIETLYKFKDSLEIGCGVGSYLRLLSVLGQDVIGIEPDSNFSKYGNENYKIQIENTFLENFKTKKTFDLISSFHVIEHVENPKYFVERCYELLNQDGILYLECPSIDNLYGDNEKFFFWKPHINSFSDITLRYLLESSNFEVIDLKHHRGFVNVVAKKRTQLYTPDLQLDSYKRIIELIDIKKNGIRPIYKNQNKNFKYKLYSLKKQTERKIRKLKEILKKKEEEKQLKKAKYRIAHLGFHNSYNTGDIALFNAVRKQYEHYLGNVHFELFDLHKEVTLDLIDRLNDFDGIIVGGGGLFLKDTNENNISGWQWAIPAEYYIKIKAPLFIHAVGYNKFRGQDDFINKFSENLNMLVEKSSFFGLRNSGSIQNISSYLDVELKKKISFQPCPTTILDELYAPKAKVKQANRKKRIGINIAFDRHNLRYGNQSEENKIMSRLCQVIKALQKQDYEVVYIIHVPRDEEFMLWVLQYNINMPIENLVGLSIDDIIKKYKTFDLIIGTRGHAQMIPFGLDISIISLISHEKLKYFLNDIKMPERGVEISSNNLISELLDKVKIFIDDSDYSDAKDNFLKCTSDNFSTIKKTLDGKL
ncbi:methyltransferase domain-containing protein [Olleya aquimaris]|uniref:Methyltransferase family protein n=1 Tax=Olleya aquimaris TaxID=639310 RepID=A0A327RLA6_9FLAO|nr:methyltransferase domain-containing protein [Olleya aquimaris]RAJ16975.1 methyltransferase family protein [Olleya aquimaris]